MVVIKDSPIQVALVTLGVPAVAISDGIFRIEFDGATEIGDRCVEVAFSFFRKTAIIVNRAASFGSS